MVSPRWRSEFRLPAGLSLVLSHSEAIRTAVSEHYETSRRITPRHQRGSREKMNIYDLVVQIPLRSSTKQDQSLSKVESKEQTSKSTVSFSLLHFTYSFRFLIFTSPRASHSLSFCLGSSFFFTPLIVMKSPIYIFLTLAASAQAYWLMGVGKHSR